mmetsp:Transcript_26746/g.39562  ORF Transcript_26746/g.39562 Transcript_26746/m.39562 type:complete len:578 (-) Transcript_26746:77-1810(-)
MNATMATAPANRGHAPGYHPFMEKLGLNKPKPAKGEPSGQQILNYLLHNEILLEKDVQRAYDDLLMCSSKNKQKGSKDTDFSPKMNCIGDENDKLNRMKSDSNSQMQQHRYRHVALRFYYEGSGYCGLAENIGMCSDNSIEKSLFAALLKTKLVESRASCNFSRCGRTDKGVSSAGQVVALRLKSNISPQASWDKAGTQSVKTTGLPKNAVDPINVWVQPKNNRDAADRVEKTLQEYSYDKVLNNVLPETIRILGWCPVSDDFSARFSAMTRTYRYFFVARPKHLDLERMDKGLQQMIGKHDFRNFCKIKVEQVYNFERLIHEASIFSTGSNNIHYFQIVGQAFLWHQIRCIVSVLFMIGRGDEDPTIVSELLDVTNNPSKPAYALAPERPLVLHACGFKELHVGHFALNLWRVSCNLERQWEELVLNAARIRNCLDLLKEVPVLHKDVLELAKSRLQERLKKKQKYYPGNLSERDVLSTLEEALAQSDKKVVSWQEALILLQPMKLIPSPEVMNEGVHIPLWKRHKGPTLEEKVELLSQSKRRQQLYDENIIKKRKSKKEDRAFYEHMTQQGGSAL